MFLIFESRAAYELANREFRSMKPLQWARFAGWREGDNYRLIKNYHDNRDLVSREEFVKLVEKYL